MATTMYLRSATWGAGNEHGKWSTGTNDANLAGTNQGWVNASRFHTVRGSAAVTLTRTPAAGPTAGAEVSSVRHWISAPLAADVTISGTITFNLRMAESVSTMNAGAQCVIERVDKLGQIASTVVNSERGTELSSAGEAAENWTASPTSTGFAKGDRIRVRVAVNDAGGTLAANTATLWLDGPTPAASGDTYITFTETLTFATGFPTGVTTLYLTDTASDIDPGGGSVDTKEAWTSRGSGNQTAVANTTTGWTSAIQWTKTAGGNTVEWYTKQLQAFTLGGVVYINLRALESNVLAAVSPRAEIAICDAAGAVVSTWAANTLNTSLTAANAAYIYDLAGDDTAVSDGQRLRIRFALDDEPDTPMVTGHTATMSYGGTAPGSTGDTYLVFGETLAEYSTAAPKPKTRRVTFTQAASQQASRW